MKYLNLSKKIAGFAITALVFTGCDKVTVQESIGDAGQTLVKILGWWHSGFYYKSSG